jgi:hypothetical protein
MTKGGLQVSSKGDDWYTIVSLAKFLASYVFHCVAAMLKPDVRPANFSLGSYRLLAARDACTRYIPQAAMRAPDKLSDFYK